MKLPELRKIFKKKYIIRVVAGALVVGLVATGSVQYTAMADKATTTEETANSLVNGDHVKVESKDLDKDQTVYLISKPARVFTGELFFGSAISFSSSLRSHKPLGIKAASWLSHLICD